MTKATAATTHLAFSIVSSKTLEVAVVVEEVVLIGVVEAGEQSGGEQSNQVGSAEHRLTPCWHRPWYKRTQWDAVGQRSNNG